MKYLAIILIVLPIGLFAQSRNPRKEVLRYQKIDNVPYHFGFTIATNMMDYAFTPSNKTMANGNVLYADVNTVNFGYTVALLGELKLSEFFAVRLLPGISYNERKVDFIEVGKENKEVVENYTSHMRSFYIDVPLLLKYKSKRMNNLRGYVVAGPCFRLNTQGGKEIDITIDRFFEMKKLEAYFEIGAGVDLYGTYYKQSIELKFSIGLNNVINNNPAAFPSELLYTEAIDKLFSRIFTLAFHFE